ncbi:MAG TPA: hypothetical protein VEZ40_04740, partial [Pyrinomonadaceae bacterium]|nr:hypothetical protein [Pyrinomonadaceae bacterium]
MRFIFSKLFYVLLALGFVPLSLAWSWPNLRWYVACYDALLLLLVFVDARASRTLPAGVEITRELAGRFHLGAETEVRVRIANHAPRPLRLRVKDEYPPELRLSSPREASLEVAAQTTARLVYGLTPTRRGRYEFGQVAVRYLSRLGLVWCAARAGAAE